MSDMSETNESSGQNGGLRLPPPEARPPAYIAPPSDQQINAVAKAMDVDGKIDWASQDHDQQVAQDNARAEARRFIVGTAAVRALWQGDLEVEEEPTTDAEKAASIGQETGNGDTGDDVGRTAAKPGTED
jgi:hypothetical protein